MNNSKSDFTQGSILGKLIPFMMPILGALILQAAYGAVDLLVVGRFGTTEGLSAVSTGSQVLNLVTFVITQFAMGVTVLIARYIGEKKTGADRRSDRRSYCCVYNDFSGAFRCYDYFFKTDCSYNAGTERSSRSYICICKNMWLRNILYSCI